MDTVTTEFIPCEPSIDVLWDNLITLDSYKNNANDLKCIIAGGYFSFKKNYNKTLSNFECELKKKKLKLSIIAHNISSNMQKSIDNGEIIIIKSQYVRLYQNEYFYNMTNEEFISNVNKNHIAKYYASFDFNRTQHKIRNKSAERNHRFISNENTKKLIDSGFPISVSYITSKSNISNKKRKLSLFDEIENNENNYSLYDKEYIFDKLMKSEIKITLKPIDIKSIFNDAWEYHKTQGAILEITDLNKNGPIKSIVKDGEILCDIGVQKQYDKHGASCVEYILLSSLGKD
jgi:hypothetical protein